MNIFAIAFFFILFSFSPAGAQIGNKRQLSINEIDSQLRNMQDMLPVEIQNGIRWVDIKRNDKEIKYTYIVNANSAEWSDYERAATLGMLQDFGCRQLLPAMCQGAQVMFDSGLTAVTAYHDSFGNFLFDCAFNPQICQRQLP